MNFLDGYYSCIANNFDTDTIGAKKIVEIYIKDLKRRIDESNDVKVKELWNEEFNGVLYPEADEFLSSIFLYGENPFIPQK